MAQLDCAYHLPNWFLVAPSYPVTEKGGHLDPNGYRWLGQQFGKVMHKVLDLGEGWKPLHPLRATLRGTQVLVDFHVPHPPLVFSPCYVRTRPTSWADGGFNVTDDDGRIAIVAAAVVAQTSVLLVLERAPGANPVIWYGDQTHHGGYGNLRDSDPTMASSVYEYREGSGQYPGANIPELIGQPYPLWNWCLVFSAALEPDPAPAVAPPPEPPKVAAPSEAAAVRPVQAEAVIPEPAITPIPAEPVAEDAVPAPVIAPEPVPVAPSPPQGQQAEAPASQPAAQGGVLAWLKRLLGGG